LEKLKEKLAAMPSGIETKNLKSKALKEKSKIESSLL